jgi:hypothetical protein
MRFLEELWNLPCRQEGAGEFDCLTDVRSGRSYADWEDLRGCVGLS